MDKIRMYQVEAEILEGVNKGKRYLVGNPDLLMTHAQACKFKLACDSHPELNRLYLIER